MQVFRALSAVVGILIVGNYAFHLLTAKKSPPSDPAKKQPSRFNASETVWHDGT